MSDLIEMDLEVPPALEMEVETPTDLEAEVITPGTVEMGVLGTAPFNLRTAPQGSELMETGIVILSQNYQDEDGYDAYWNLDDSDADPDRVILLPSARLPRSGLLDGGYLEWDISGLYQNRTAADLEIVVKMYVGDHDDIWDPDFQTYVDNFGSWSPVNQLIQVAECRVFMDPSPDDTLDGGFRLTIKGYPVSRTNALGLDVEVRGTSKRKVKAARFFDYDYDRVGAAVNWYGERQVGFSVQRAVPVAGALTKARLQNRVLKGLLRSGSTDLARLL